MGVDGAAIAGRATAAPLRLDEAEVQRVDSSEAPWSDDPPAKARSTLDTTLHRLRALLGEDVLPLVEGTLAIDRTRCFVDAWAFASLAERATRELRRPGAFGPTAEALELFADARQLYATRSSVGLRWRCVRHIGESCGNNRQPLRL